MIRGDKCKRGHEMTPENTYVYANGVRQCRQCQALIRKAKRHATGQSVGYRGPGTILDRVSKAALEAFVVLGEPGGDQQVSRARQILGDALGWPEGGAK